MTKETYTISVCDAGDRNNVPLIPRLRRLLKAMLRGYGIRCFDIRHVPSSPTTKDEDGTGDIQ